MLGGKAPLHPPPSIRQGTQWQWVNYSSSRNFGKHVKSYCESGKSTCWSAFLPPRPPPPPPLEMFKVFGVYSKLELFSIILDRNFSNVLLNIS